MTQISRRSILAGIASFGASPLWAEELTGSPIPQPRPDDLQKRALPSGADLAKYRKLSGKYSFALASPQTGKMVESGGLTNKLPPASVAKVLTALYALEFLGAERRFVTRLLATGPIEAGVLKGDLILAGGGDPTLNTDQLAELAQALKNKGIRSISGGLHVYDGALPKIKQIDNQQTSYAGYNPTITGMNLNYNRVHFEWKKADASYSLTMEARGAKYSPKVSVAKMRIVDRGAPVFGYTGGKHDNWTVAKSESSEIARISSPTIRDLVHGMLKHSTNITAEILGLSASFGAGVEPTTLRQSADAMNKWAADRFGITGTRLVDHSGLGGDNSQATRR